jgi:hypothetical protein
LPEAARAVGIRRAGQVEVDVRVHRGRRRRLDAADERDDLERGTDTGIDFGGNDEPKAVRCSGRSRLRHRAGRDRSRQTRKGNDERCHGRSNPTQPCAFLGRTD